MDSSLKFKRKSGNLRLKRNCFQTNIISIDIPLVYFPRQKTKNKRILIRHNNSSLTKKHTVKDSKVIMSQYSKQGSSGRRNHRPFGRWSPRSHPCGRQTSLFFPWPSPLATFKSQIFVFSCDSIKRFGRHWPTQQSMFEQRIV